MNAIPPTPGTAAPAPSPPSLLEVWSRPVQAALAVLLFATIIFISAHVIFGDLRDARPTDLEPGSFPTTIVDLNNADKALLRQLPEVGDALADRIEEYRRERGGFRTVDELRNVSGIGPKKLARIRPWVYVEDDGSEDEEATVRTVSLTGKKTAMPAGDNRGRKGETLTGPVDINEASEEKLKEVPGIGKVTAARIVAARKQKPFESVDDLRRVPGIGAKTLEKLRPYLTVSKKRVA
jgi:competence protein ComEA